MNHPAPSYHGYRFPPEIISHAVWLYHRFCLSFRDVEDLLAQRGVAVSYEAIRQWCLSQSPSVPSTETSRPDASSVTVSTEPRPGNGVATGASDAARRSRRRKAPPITVFSTAGRRSTRLLRCASRASIFPRSPGSNGWLGTPWPAGSSGPPRCVADLTTGGSPASSPQNCKPARFARSPGGRPGRRGCSRRLRSGRVSGRRPSSADAATGTPWRSFVTSRRA